MAAAKPEMHVSQLVDIIESTFQLGMHRNGFFRFGRTGPNQAASRTEANRITFIYCRSFRVLNIKLLINNDVS